MLTLNFEFDIIFGMKDKVQLNRKVKQFQIRKNNPDFKTCDDICFKSKNMFNYTLYVLRQLNFASYPEKNKDGVLNPPEFYLNLLDEGIRKLVQKKEVTVKCKETCTKTTRTIYEVSKFDFFTYCASVDQKDYRNLQITGSRSAINKAYESMKSFNKSLIDYYKNPSKYKGCPSLPHFKNKETGRSVVAFDSFKTDSNFHIAVNNVKFNTINIKDIVENGNVIKQIRIVPQLTNDIYVVEIVYVDNSKYEQINGDNCVGIDIGINNLCALAFSNDNYILFNGKPLKNINQYYNKEKAKLQAQYIKQKIYSGAKSRKLELDRMNKINTFLHQTSKKVVDLVLKNGAKYVFIGHNNGWKQEVNIGKRNNQTFVQIPFNSFSEKLKYKLEDHGCIVETINEAYTSKCSGIDYEEICKHDEYVGYRGGKHNKEFVSKKSNKLVNADINGAFNILRLGMKKYNMNEPKFSYNIYMPQTESLTQTKKEIKN